MRTSSNVSRRSFLHLAGASATLAAGHSAAAAGLSGGAAPAGRKPNVIFILTDQHNVRGLGCYGGPDVRTPNLDALARDGVRFDQAYCQMPVCVPNRSSIFTGRYPHTLRTYTNDCTPRLEEPMLPWYFASAGYATGGYGKTHFSYNEERGFRETDISFGNYNRFLEANGVGARYPNPPTTNDWPHCGYVGDSPIPAELSFANWVTNNGERFVERHRDQPFMLYLGYYGPHPPYQAPKPYADAYEADRLFVPPRFTREQRMKRPRLMRNAAELSDAQIREVLRHYYGLCTHIDECIGRLLGRLDALGLSNNTLVVFSTDHGNHLGSYNRFGKNWTLHDSCLRVPWLMRFPGRIPGGRAPDGIVQSIDLLPTMLELAGLEVPDRVQGESRALMATGREQAGRDAAFCASWSGHTPADTGKISWGQQCIRTATHKLITWTTGEQEMYDLKNDPWEYDNIAGSPAARDAQWELQQRLLTWWLEMQDRVAADGRDALASKRRIDERLAFARRSGN